MTPQLQQAIKLLQLSTLDLELEIQQALDSNIMLEEVDPELDDSPEEETSLDTPEEDIEGNANDDSTVPTNADDSAAETESLDPEIDGDAIADSRNEVDAESIEEDLPIDTSWEDIYDDNVIGANTTAPSTDDNFLENRNSVSETIQSHMIEQLNLLHLTESD
ncbi:MAG: RNA polymerase factor sigma-54, partial [Gammaproteobacteria bacterium]